MSMGARKKFADFSKGVFNTRRILNDHLPHTCKLRSFEGKIALFFSFGRHMCKQTNVSNVSRKN